MPPGAAVPAVNRQQRPASARQVTCLSFICHVQRLAYLSSLTHKVLQAPQANGQASTAENEEQKTQRLLQQADEVHLTCNTFLLLVGCITCTLPDKACTSPFVIQTNLCHH